MREKTRTAIAIEAMTGEARLRGAREIRFHEDRVVIVDHFRNETEISHGDCGPEAVKSELAGSDYWHNLPWNARDTDRNLPGSGRWSLTASDDSVVLKAKKAFPPCLEAVAETEAEMAEIFRSLYGEEGFDVYVACEGAERARAFASALAAERVLAGYPTALSLPAPDRYGDYGRDGVKAVRSEAGCRDRGPVWQVSVLSPREKNPVTEDGWDGEGVRVTVTEASSYEASRVARATMPEGRRRPVVIVSVTLEDSRPVARIRLPAGVTPRLSTEGWTPWGEFAERKAKAQASRPQAVKTWHPTTAHVARAFVEREALRGFTGVDSLFFHGPVAFSLRTWNPIAAFVDIPDGKTLLLMGRSSDAPSGGKGGTISMAQGDVGTAARDRYEILHVDDLCDFVTWGSKPLDRVAIRMKHMKDEDTLPTSCRIDRRKLSRWLKGKQERLEEEAADAMRTRFPTGKQANALSNQASLVDLRDRLVELTGIALPDVGDAGFFREERDRILASVRERQEELEARRKEASSEASPEAGAFRP